MKTKLPNDVYNTFMGSFALVQALLNNKLNSEEEIQHFKTLYFRAKKKKWKSDDPDLLYKIAKHFECEYKTDSVCMVVSPYNILFSFYVENKDKTLTVLPLREDGYLPITLKTGKIYPLKEIENVSE